MSTHPVITPTCADHGRRWHDLGERGWADLAALEYPHGHRVALGEGGMRRSEVARWVAVCAAYLLVAGAGPWFHAASIRNLAWTGRACGR